MCIKLGEQSSSLGKRLQQSVQNVLDVVALAACAASGDDAGYHRGWGGGCRLAGGGGFGLGRVAALSLSRALALTLQSFRLRTY